MPEPEHDHEASSIEAGILERLTEERDHRPWSVDGLAREVGVDLATRDAVAKFQRLGLVHLCCELVFPTRAAIHAERLRQ